MGPQSSRKGHGMDNQNPSKGALIASALFFVVCGVVLTGVGISGLSDPEQATSSFFVMLLGISSFAFPYIAFKKIKALEHEPKHAKHAKAHEHEKPAHHPKSVAESSMSGIGSILVLLVVLVIGFWIVKGAWSFASDRFGPKSYHAFFYYNPANLNQYWDIQVGSIEECRDWVDEQVGRDFDGQYDYECGVNCKYDSSVQVYVCKETVE